MSDQGEHRVLPGKRRALGRTARKTEAVSLLVSRGCLFGAVKAGWGHSHTALQRTEATAQLPVRSGGGACVVCRGPREPGEAVWPLLCARLAAVCMLRSNAMAQRVTGHWLVILNRACWAGQPGWSRAAAAPIQASLRWVRLERVLTTSWKTKLCPP